MVKFAVLFIYFELSQHAIPQYFLSIFRLLLLLFWKDSVNQQPLLESNDIYALKQFQFKITCYYIVYDAIYFGTCGSLCLRSSSNKQPLTQCTGNTVMGSFVLAVVPNPATGTPVLILLYRLPCNKFFLLY